jgi:hypothetical protein
MSILNTFEIIIENALIDYQAKLSFVMTIKATLEILHSFGVHWVGNRARFSIFFVSSLDAEVALGELDLHSISFRSNASSSTTIVVLKKLVGGRPISVQGVFESSCY